MVFLWPSLPLLWGNVMHDLINILFLHSAWSHSSHMFMIWFTKWCAIDPTYSAQNSLFYLCFCLNALVHLSCFQTQFCHLLDPRWWDFSLQFCLAYQSFYIQNSILSFSVFLALQWISISYPVLVLLFCSTVHFYPLQINSEVCVFFVLNYSSWFSHFLCFCIGTWTHAGLDRNRETNCFTLWPFLWAVGV